MKGRRILEPQLVRSAIAIVATLPILACQPSPESRSESGRAIADASDSNKAQTPATTDVADAESNPMSASTRDTAPLVPLSPDNPDPEVQAIVDRYLDNLVAQGFDRQQQSVWVQTDDRLLAQWQGTTRLPAASVTKIATTLGALRTFAPDRRFTTEFSTTGTIENGVLSGDLIVSGSRDPMFVWEDAIAVGNALNEMGIREVRGNLVVVGDFFMNFEEDFTTSAELLANGLNASRWTAEASAQHATLPAGTPQPQVAIGGSIRFADALPADRQPRIAYDSRPLAELLDQMNRYSNNAIAQIVADSAGGAGALVREAIAATSVDPSEIQLINGSGLGRENQISPRAAVMMYQAINQELAPHGLTVADVVAIAGIDAGIFEARPRLPERAVLKSGSLNAVSTMSGGIPTASGAIWLAIMNGGGDTDALRSAQEDLIEALENYGGRIDSSPPELTPTPNRNLAPQLRLLP